ncbi:hypothetical protein Gpo141_00000473 [Globisporangium polare]
MARTGGGRNDRRRRVARVLLSSTDISVVNRTTLSLWHFQQLAQQLLPRAAASNGESPEDDKDDGHDTDVVPAVEVGENDDPDLKQQLQSENRVLRGKKKAFVLGEGMGVAALAYEPEESETSDSESSGESDGDEKAALLLLDDSDTENEQQHAESAVAAMTAQSLQSDSDDSVLLGARLTPATEVVIVYKRYRCVVCLDASPSTLSIDPATGRLFLDMLYESVELFIWGLLGKMLVGDKVFVPEIHLSVMVQGAQVESLSVLVQGYIVNPSNVVQLLHLIKERIHLIEDDWAVKAQEEDYNSDDHQYHSTRASLSWMLQNAVFALNSLPSDAAPVLVMVTDGVVDLFDAYSYDNLLMQLVRHDVHCHFLRVGGGENAPNSSFGFVPDVDLLRFIAGTTGGAVFDYLALHEACYGQAQSDAVKEMTAMQEACFVRTSSVHAISTPVLKLDELCCTSFDGRTLLPLRPYRMWREKVHEYRICADVERIMEARIREGFTVNKVHIKTYQKPVTDAPTTTTANKKSPESPRGDSGGTGSVYRDVTKILVVFLLQWKQNVWLEYVVSSTTESTTTSTAASAAARRFSGQGLSSSGIGNSFSSSKPTHMFAKEQAYVGKWSEWYVKVNILAYSDFLRAFEDSAQMPNGSNALVASVGSGSPHFLHEYIRNVQDVDRVLLHLMTATAAAIAPVESGNQYSFGTSGNLSSSVANSRQQQNAHPVFNIIGELSPVLWHRWFYVERFELLCVVKNESCNDVFYRNEEHEVIDRARSVRKGFMNQSRGFLQLHGGPQAQMYSVAIGVERISERLMAAVQKWSSQRLSKDLFLRFLLPSTRDKHLLRNKASGATLGMGKRQQRPSNPNAQIGGIGGLPDEPASINGGSKSSLCFVRVEIKSKTLVAIHVAFFSTTAAARKQTLNDLKANIIFGLNDVPPSPLATTEQTNVVPKSVVLSQRLISRLLVTHETLLLHDGLDDSGSHDHNWGSSGVQAVSSCCGGSELQLRSVFGSYMWHSSWRWHISNPSALLNVMRRLHEARIESGFWVLDWTMESDEDGQNPQLQSIIFGREILMEDENGNTKTSLVQYALRRVSETCLMTSIWMEPQHGLVKTQLSGKVEAKDKFHWGLRHAVGHDIPCEEVEFTSIHRSLAMPATTTRTSPPGSSSHMEEERRSMEKEDVSIDWYGSTYLGENDLLQLIRGYIFKSDRHFLSCLHTFDCVMNFRESMQHLSQMNKDIEDIVGSTWGADKLHAATLKQLLPPFSTTRLLRTSKRSAEHFLMYLENGPPRKPEAKEETALVVDTLKVSVANEHLYSMLERTLRGLSDCEVAWTDCNGNDISKLGSGIADWEDVDQLIKEGMSGQMPLWLKDHISPSFQDKTTQNGLSKGKCFAKMVSDDTVVLAFLPSLDCVQVRQKGPDKLKRRATTSAAQLSENQTRLRAEPKIHREKSSPEIQNAVIEPHTSSRLMRMSVSADDIVLYQERRLSFREGYKSWRMGHYQGAKDGKQSTSGDFHNLRLASTPEDHEFCEEVSRQTDYGCDFHLLIERDDGGLGSGFFQVAFYECSLTRLSVDLQDCNKKGNAARLDLPQRILKQLFFSGADPVKNNEEPASTPAVAVAKDARPKPPVVHSPAGALPTSMFPTPMPAICASSVASRRFQKKVKRAHEHNFSRGVYIALREGSNVQQSDLLQALTSCIEVPVDLDITLLYRMMQASSPKRDFQSLVAGNQRAALKEKLDRAFETILSSLFVPIPGTKYYYFTGSETVMLEDSADSESDLHLLMDESEEVSSSTVPEDDVRPLLNDGGDGVREPKLSVEASPAAVFSPASKPPLPKASPRAALSSGADVAKAGRRFKDQGRPPPVKTSADELPPIEQHPGIEEDAEFNKEVAVATSIFSAPFFFRFECREISTPRARTGSASEAVSASRDGLLRSSSTQSFVNMRKDLAVKTGGAREEFQPRFDSLLSKKETQEEMVAQVAEWFGKAASSRIALRLITLTLPTEQLVDPSRQAATNQQMPFEMDDSVHGGKLPLSRAQVIATLPHFQRQALKRVRKDIKEWCSVEVLDILRAAKKITPSISQLVQRLFEDLPPQTLTKAKYPLEFVATSQDALGNPVDLFKKELERGTSLRVHESNGVYYVIDSKQLRACKSVDDATAADEADSFEIPFWAYFTVESDHVALQLHHPDRFAPFPQFDRLGVLTRLHMGVMDACKRVNQFLLLLQLHETRTCNGYLLPGSSNQVSSPRSPRRRDSASNAFGLGVSEHFFWPGQFQCDLQYSACFKLHERLSASMALSILCTSALEQFQVHNRRYMFVYRDRGGHVFYMKISIKHEEQTPGQEKLDRRRVTRIGSGTLGGTTTPSSAAPTSSGAAGILLEVFGVCTAGEEVTHELCRVLERKLDEATQLILMKLLARNAKFQLSSSDMAFVCPSGGKPAQIIEFVLPAKLQGVSSLLHFLSQTFSAAPYVRHVTNVASSSRAPGDAGDGGVMRGGRRHSLHGGSADKQAHDEKPKPPGARNPAFVHPSLFFVCDNPTDIGEDNSGSDVISPVFMSPRHSARSETTVKPNIVDQVSYVLNLNPELRLSPGFLSRIGRGLAVLRIELVQDQTIKEKEDDDGHVVKSLEGFDIASKPDSEEISVVGTHQVVRCQLWIRGSINTNELAQLVESNLREAMLDYQIEATLKTLSVSSTVRESSSLPQEAVYLTSLFERSCSLSSASVTKLVLPTSLAPWDVQHVVHQLHSFLRCVPAHLRPAVYSKRKAGDKYKSHEIGGNLENGELSNELNDRQYFRMIARLGAKLPESSSDLSQAGGQHHHPPPHSSRGLHLNHSDSIQSNISEMDSNKLSLTWTSMSGSESNINALTQSNSSNASTSVSVSLSSVKEFSENELLLYPNTHSAVNLASSSSSVDMAASGSSFDEDSSSSRSFYYVIDVSCTDGVQVFGYNMSNTVVDTILVQFARILTWAKLRESLLRNLLFEKSGLSRAAPFGSNVVHPRDLYMGGGGSAMGKNSFVLPKDFCVNFVEFWRPAMMILTGNAAIPRLLDSALLRSIEGSSLGKYLREAHTVASDRDMHRPRAPSNASLQAGNNGPPDLHREASSQSSSRSLRGENTGQPKNMSAIGRGGSSTGMKTLPSPKRGMPVGSTGAYPSGNSGAAAANPRMRQNAGAANALLAARARARGALPGRLGGPGASSKPAGGADSVAPWDLPLTNTKGPVLTGSGAPDAAGSGATEVIAVKPPASIGLPTDAGAKRPASVKAGNASLRELGSPISSPVHGFGPGFTGSHSRQNSSTLNDAAGVSFSWRKQLEFAWGPRFKYHGGFASFPVDDKASKVAESTSDQLRKNPLLRFSDAFQNRWLKYEDRSTSHTICVNLFDKLVAMKAGEEMDEPVALSIVDRMMQGGHQLVHQRFRVTFVERWEVIKVDEEYMEEDMQDGRLRALQASMDLVNLLSYKKEFVFTGNECTIANFYTEHTVLGMCANEGDAVRDMKKQIMKNIFHLKMEVAHDFYEQYAIHLRALGFRHLRTLSNNQSNLRAIPVPASSTSLSSLSVVDMVASDGEGFTEYFYFPGKSQGKMKGWQSLMRGSAAATAYPATLLLLELKCDHHGVRLGVVLVNESDLLQQDMGFQSRLQPKSVAIDQEKKAVVSGEMVRLVSTWLRETLRTRAIIYGFTIRFFQKYLTKWSNDQHERRQATGSNGAFDADHEMATADGPLLSSSLSSLQSGHDVQSFQNIVKGVRCFLHAYPEPPSAPAAKAPSASASSSSLSTLDRGLQQSGNLMAQQSSLLRTAVVELPPTQLHSNCSESILVKILLRYIACHGARYEVLDLMQFGTPDAVVCHSPSGSFFHRQPSSGGPKPFGYLPPRKQFSGYSLLITTQSLVEGFGLQASDKKRRKNCIQLILLKSATGGPPLGVGNGVLPFERALMEAEFFVQELFRVAAQHYERDLLWSRLLYDDTTGPGAKVASTLALPANHFQVEVGPQQLEECLRLSVCTPLEEIDPTLAQLLAVDGVCWQEFALRLRDLYADQLREYQFAGEEACHFLLLCPNTHDLIIHLTFENGLGEEPLLDFGDSAVSSSVSSRDNYNNFMAASGSSSSATESTNRVKIEICRREEPPNRSFTFAQRRVITEFINSVVHWQWRSLLYD